MPRAVSRRIPAPTAPVSAGRAFAAGAASAGRLHQLVAAFAAALCERGFSSHHCFCIEDQGAPTPLFGDDSDLRRHVAATGYDAPVARSCGGGSAAIIPVETWQGERWVVVALTTSAIDRPTLAWLHGLAALYVTYGEALLARESDIATESGLGLLGRTCLGMLLAGRRDSDIADALGCSLLAVERHLQAAIEELGAEDRAEAVALAARRGWLLFEDLRRSATVEENRHRSA